MTMKRTRTTTTTFASVLLLLLASATTVTITVTATVAAVSDPHLESVKEIWAWIDSAKDGFVTKKQSVSRMVEENIDTPLIVFANQDIKRGELLVQTPWSHILQSEDPDKDDKIGWYCGATRKLAEEMKKGADSFYAPYVTYINDEPDGQLPTQYSFSAKQLLWQVIGLHRDELNRSQVFDRKEAFDHRLMPEFLTDGLERNWYKTCQADRDDATMAKAASMIIQRADDDILIPAYDAYNHRNVDNHNDKRYMNARTQTTDEQFHQTFAQRDIQKGEQIFISYNMCEQCGGRRDYGFGTAEIFREYGFVEWFPQRWWYPGFGDYSETTNDLEMNQFDLNKNEESGDISVVWTHLTDNQQKLDRFKQFLGHEIRRLNRLKNIEWADMYSWNDDEMWKKSKISAYEWSNINQFVDANIVAMTLALEDLGRDLEEGKTQPRKRPPLTVPPEELTTLLAEGNHYDTLEEPEIDDLAYFKYTCDNSESFEFMGYVDTENAFYTDRDQILGYFESHFFNEKADEVDVCFDINNTVQICSSYRPYHHEYITHAAARYVETVKRVAFVGNGDSMLLHEIMKYPDLELVVGLELDQTVTRKSFKHYKTDPYFHDPRVDWWFGDAAKSLLVLPESYWGSFDLVLVHLSENVLSNQVTKDLDMISALGMLVNPNTGVIVQNELCLTKFAEVFDYSMELFFKTHMLCSETLAFGSKGVDFFHAPIYDHGIADMDNILYTTAPVEAEDRHSMMHDYRTKAGKKCTSDENETANDSVDREDDEYQTTALGVLELVTLEELTSPLDSFETIAESMKTCIEGIGGFTIIQDGVHYEEKPHGLALVVMQEGYVAARVQQNENTAEDDDDDEDSFYVGFDIHLWSQTHRIEALTDTFSKTYRSEHISSHKIVVGGMFGTENWKEDAKHVGPMSSSSSKPTCDTDTKDAAKTTGSSSSFDADSAGGMAIEEIVSLALAQDAVAAVFCGSESDSCISLDVLKDHKLVKEAIPLYDCASAGDDNTKQLYACERKIIAELKAKLSSDKLHMFVLDSNASQKMHQIANSIFDTHENRAAFLHSHSIAVAWSSNDVDSSNEPWRWEFLDRYRKQIHHDPVKLGEFMILSGGNENHAYRFGLVSTNDPGINVIFDSFEKQLQDRLRGDARVELRNIHGGLYNYDEGHDFPSFSEENYDKTLAEEHFENQIPLARQSIFQYEATDQLKELTSQGQGMNWNFVEKLIYGSAISNNEGPIVDPSKQMMFLHPVGHGCVVLMVGETFNIITVWDGRDHLIINIFDFSSTSLAEKFDQRLRELSPFLSVAIDSQPRGLGRVVNFPEDIVMIDREKMEDDDEADDEEEDDDEYEDEVEVSLKEEL